jgi:hypothetical protein
MKADKTAKTLLIAASIIQVVGAPIAYHMGDRLFAGGNSRLICFAAIDLVGFALVWIGLYRLFDRDLGKAMFVALFATLGLFPISVIMIIAIPVLLSIRGFYFRISTH